MDPRLQASDRRDRSERVKFYMEKPNRWQWFNDKICMVQFLNPVMVCNKEHQPVSTKEGPAVAIVLRGLVKADGPMVLVSAALDEATPEFLWTFGLHEGDIQTMVLVERRIIQ